jgi:hypothetical protein
LCVIPSRVQPSFFEGTGRRPYGSGWYNTAGRLLTMPHSVARWQGVSGAVAGHDSKVCSGMGSPLTWTTAGVSALNAPARGAGMEAAALVLLEQDGNSLEGAFGSRSRWGLARGWAPSPRARRSPARGSYNPRARRICTEVAPYPSSGAEFRLRVAGPIV